MPCSAAAHFSSFPKLRRFAGAARCHSRFRISSRFLTRSWLTHFRCNFCPQLKLVLETLSVILPYRREDSGSFAEKMKTKDIAAGMKSPQAAPSENTDTKFLGAVRRRCAGLAAVVALYIQFWVVPAQLDIHEQSLKLEKLRSVACCQLAVAHRDLFSLESYGTLIRVGALGLLGCGFAYVRRSAKLANWMIDRAGRRCCWAGLVIAVISNVVKG